MSQESIKTKYNSGVGMTSQRTRDRMVANLQKLGVNNKKVLEVMRLIPRHVFIEEALIHRAYDDTVLPIGEGQTISKPSVVALMTQAALNARRSNNVLEIGTGCGYQTSVLAACFSRVCTMERIHSLQQQAQARLRDFGYRNIEYRHGDGFVGWRDRAPFDAILVAAAADTAPKQLLDQLAEGGVLVMPQNGNITAGEHENSIKIYQKTSIGIDERVLIAADFVPFKRGVTA